MGCFPPILPFKIVCLIFWTFRTFSFFWKKWFSHKKTFCSFFLSFFFFFSVCPLFLFTCFFSFVSFFWNKKMLGSLTLVNVNNGIARDEFSPKLVFLRAPPPPPEHLDRRASCDEPALPCVGRRVLNASMPSITCRSTTASHGRDQNLTLKASESFSLFRLLGNDP